MSSLQLRDVQLGMGGPTVDVSVTAGVVTAIGSGLPRADEVIDGQGGTLLPGLVDVHVHATQWASSRHRIPLAQATSAAAAVDLVRSGAAVGAEELVMGHGFRDGAWPDVPHKDMLERALPGQPVALFSNDLHTLWLSPAALEMIGWEHPTGVLLENDCMAATAALPSASESTLDSWVLQATDPPTVCRSSRPTNPLVDHR